RAAIAALSRARPAQKQRKDARIGLRRLGSPKSRHTGREMLATATPAFVPTDYEWLRLRFEADRRSRSDALLSRVREHCTGRPTLRVLDLGAGAGANLVYLAPRLPVDEQDWVLVDRDGALLDRVPACCRALGSASPSMEVEPGRL